MENGRLVDWTDAKLGTQVLEKRTLALTAAHFDLLVLLAAERERFLTPGGLRGGGRDGTGERRIRDRVLTRDGECWSGGGR